MEKAKQINVVIIGDSGVGKSSILLRYATGDYKDNLDPTIGASFMTKLVIYRGHTIKYQFWDTAGQEKFLSLARMYYRESQVAVLVYDLTNRASFNGLKQWILDLKEQGPADMILAVVGNKVDLVSEEQISIEEGTALAKELGAVFKLTSAKENKGINDLFDKITEEIVNSAKIEVKPMTAAQKLSMNADKKDAGCC